MNSLVRKFSGTGYDSELRRAHEELEEDGFNHAVWGSAAGFGNLSKGVPMFKVPSVPNVRISYPLRSINISLSCLIAIGIPTHAYR